MLSPLVMLIWIVNVGLDTLGQVGFKYAAIAQKNKEGWDYWRALFKNHWVWVGIVAYIIEFFTWLAFLSRVELSFAVLLSSINIISIMIVGRLLFNEILISERIIGMILITVGVIFVGVF